MYVCVYVENAAVSGLLMQLRRLAVGLVSMATPIYLSESSPEQYRGAIVAINVLFITTGQFISYVVDLALFNTQYEWRWMLGISAVPAIIQFFGMLFLTETPRWLISKVC